MAYPTLLEVRTALATVLQTLDPDGLQVNKYMIFKPQPPAICLSLTDIRYNIEMGPGYLLEFYLWIIFSKNDLEEAQARLDTYLDVEGSGSATSIEEKLYEDQTLGGVVSDVVVHQMARIPGLDEKGQSFIRWYGTEVWGAPLKITVLVGEKA